MELQGTTSQNELVSDSHLKTDNAHLLCDKAKCSCCSTFIHLVLLFIINLMGLDEFRVLSHTDILEVSSKLCSIMTNVRHWKQRSAKMQIIYQLENVDHGPSPIL